MKLQWDKSGERFFETGVDRGVLYPMSEGSYQAGVAWNGITGVNENPSGAEPTPLYADNIKYLTLTSAEEFGYTIEAFQSPEEFDACDGTASIIPGITISQQTRKHFGFCWRTLIGNDEEGTDKGYIIHIAYDCLASPSGKEHSTVNESPEAVQLSWEVDTTPIAVEGRKPTAHLLINSTKIAADTLKAIEDILYGTEDKEARLLEPDEIVELFGTTENNGENGGENGEDNNG